MTKRKEEIKSRSKTKASESEFLTKAQIRRATKSIFALLRKTKNVYTEKELFKILTAETSFSKEEIEAGLNRLRDDGRLVPEGKNGWRVPLRHVSFEGTVLGTRSGTYQIESSETGETFWLSGNDYIPVLPGDTVFVTPTGEMDRNLRVAKIQEVCSRQKTQLVCKVMRKASDFLLCAPVDPLCHTLVAVKGNLRKLKGKVFLVQLKNDLMYLDWKWPILTGEVTQIFGALDDANAELEVAVHQFDLPYQFSEATLKEAEKLPDNPSEKELAKRVDLRDIPFVTIDGEDARDFDDAVYCAKADKGFRLYVAIADVSYYVKEGSAIDLDAQRRMTSVYFPRRVIPMLPEKLSNGLCSLNPHVNRAALVCDMLIDTKGDVLTYSFYPAMIESKARLTYTSVFAALSGEAADLKARGAKLDDIQTLYELFKVLRAAREKRGAIDFETTETEVLCDEVDGTIKAIKKREHNDAHRMIEEAMLAANTCAADFLKVKKRVALYRVHPTPDKERLQNLRATLAAFKVTLAGGDKPTAADFQKVLDHFKDNPVFEVVQMAMLRAMPQAFYSPFNCGHYGLNYKAYTHFTSPIRRYPDLLLHRAIRFQLSRRKYKPELHVDTAGLMASKAGAIVQKLALRLEQGGDAKVSDEILPWKKLGIVASAAERRADEASRDVEAWLKCRYLEPMVGQSFKGRITGINQAGLYVTLNEVFIEGFVHISRIDWDYYYFNAATNMLQGEDSRREFRVGDKITVRLIGVDVDSRRIDFECVSGGSRSKHYNRDWEYDYFRKFM